MSANSLPPATYASRTKEEIYDDMLALQASMSFPLEVPLLHSEVWERSRTVLDFGSANSAYTSLLAGRWPTKTFLCLEKNPLLAAFAGSRCKSANVKVTVGDESNITGIYDFIIARLVLSHVPSRERVVGRLASMLAPGGGLLIIDADDGPLKFNPPLPKFWAALQQLRKQVNDRGGERNSWDLVHSEWAPHGINIVSELRMIPNSLLSGLDSMFRYMKLTAEYALGNPLPLEISEEFDQWKDAHNAYAQYGIFGVLLEKKP